MKRMLITIVMFGFLSGCSNTSGEPTNTQWPDSKRGGGHYFDGRIDNNPMPYLYPHPLGNSNIYLEWQNDAEVSTDNYSTNNYSAFNYPYGNSGTHLND